MKVTTVAGLLSMLLCHGCSGPPAGSGGGGEAAVAAGSKPRVQTLTPTRATLSRKTTQPATVHPNQQAHIHAKVSGYLAELKADIGQSVAAGDALGILDVPEMGKQRDRQALVVEQLEAEEVRAQSEVDLAQANVESAQALLEQTRSQVQSYQAQLDADQSEFNRIQELVASRTVNDRLLDEARKRLDSAKASKSAAESAVVSAEAAVRVAQAKHTAAKALQTTAVAETNVARKQLEEVDELIKYTTLTAPFAGVVTERNVDLGDLVRNTQSSGGGAPLFTVAQVDTVRVRVSIPEGDAPWCQAGDRVALQFKSLGGKSIDGQVARVSKSLEASTRTMLAEIDLPNPEGTLLPGMYGEATIFMEEHADVLTLPASAVRYSETGQASVYVVDGSSAIQIVNVTTGLDDGKQLEITSGLDEQARVVDAMIGRLQPGQKVQTAGK